MKLLEHNVSSTRPWTLRLFLLIWTKDEFQSSNLLLLNIYLLKFFSVLPVQFHTLRLGDLDLDQSVRVFVGGRCVVAQAVQSYFLLCHQLASAFVHLLKNIRLSCWVKIKENISTTPYLCVVDTNPAEYCKGLKQCNVSLVKITSIAL